MVGCLTQKPDGASVSQPAKGKSSAAPAEADAAAVEDELEKIINAGEEVNAEAQRLTEQVPNTGTEEEQSAARKELSQRIEQMYAGIRKQYEDFIKRHPKHGGGYAAYGDFLLGHYDEEAAIGPLEKALKLDKTIPSAYNDLANIHGHRGDVKKAFEYYAKATELDPTESVYYHNFATTVFLFRTDAKEFYSINEQQVFDKAMMLYSNSLRLDPTNFALASDIASSYYGIKPWRFEDALQSWTNALTLAHDEVERESVHTHFARVKTQAGRFDEARAHLHSVTNEASAPLKDRMLRNIAAREEEAKTNTPAANSRTGR
jgi:tetratricopeptide (TPR) repeat protein